MRPEPKMIGAMILGVAALDGCSHNHSRITPTTTGTDLRHMPSGRMTPLPFPGSDLAHRPVAATGFDLPTFFATRSKIDAAVTATSTGEQPPASKH